MKRSPLRRNTPLKRTAFKKRVNSRKQREWSAARTDAIAKAGGRCRVGQHGCSGQAEHVHHIKRRSQGGGNELNNLLVCCHVCHGWIHANVAEAAKHGWLQILKD